MKPTARTSSPRKVMVAFALSYGSGRDGLTGVFRHLGGRGNWNLRLVQSEAELLAEISSARDGAGVDGFIVTAPFVTEAVAAALSKTDVPTVLMNVPPEVLSSSRKNVVFVRNDDERIGVAAAQYFLSLGRFRSHAFVPTARAKDWCDRRERGFKAELARRGAPCATYAAGNSADAPADRKALGLWLKALPKPAAVMAAFDERALQVMECCREMRIDVPGQVALIGVDNDVLLCENAAVPLASVIPDNEQAGADAAALLDSLMRGRRRNAAKRPETRTYMPKGIAERASAKPISPAAGLISRAMVFIRQHAASDIRVPDVVGHLGVSRRLADKRFREYQGESILQTITRIRLDEVKRRLQKTNASIKSISTSCGFPDANYLKILFRRHTGMTMREWRASKG